MTTQPQHQDDDEITFIDFLLFLKASGRNVLLSTAICLSAGTAYYLSEPKIYEASATIQMAMLAGEVVEPPALLLEKIKLPLFFSAATLGACGSDREIIPNNKFVDKLKPTLNKSASLISFSTRANSVQEARACLEAVISEIRKSQNELAKPLIEQKKEKLALLTDQLKLAKDMTKSFPAYKAGINTSEMLNTHTLLMTSALANATEVNDFRRQIFTLETNLAPPQTQPTSLAAPLYAPEVPFNKRPLFTLGLSLGLGVLLGLLGSGVMRVASEIRRQIREREAKLS